MSEVRAYSIRVHERAKLSCEEFENRLEFKLINTVTGKSTERTYLRLDTGIDAREAMKIDAIVYHMHNEIGLNVWSSKQGSEQ